MLRKRITLLVCALVICAGAQKALAQESTTPQKPASASSRDDETNLDIQLFLILATNREAEDGKLPTALQPVLTRLHEAMNFKHYSLAASLLNRVRHNGRLETSWVGGPMLAISSPMGNPSFNEFTAGRVRVDRDSNGHEIIQMVEFRFGSRVPIITAQTTTTSASTSAIGGFPVINYQLVGLRTDISMSENVPVIAGTLNVGPSGDAIIVVVSAKRATN